MLDSDAGFFGEKFILGYMFITVLILAVAVVSACGAPWSSAQNGRYVETRANGAIVIAHEDFCSAGAFDNTRCTWTYFCLKTPLPEIQVGDVVHLSGCYSSVQDYAAAIRD